MNIGKHNNPKSTGCSKSNSKSEVYRNTSLTQETRKISNSLTLHLKELEEEEEYTKLLEGKKQ